MYVIVHEFMDIDKSEIRVLGYFNMRNEARIEAECLLLDKDTFSAEVYFVEQSNVIETSHEDLLEYAMSSARMDIAYAIAQEPTSRVIDALRRALEALTPTSIEKET